ncbi:hypothetical protein [Robertkochia flava]|uniref:hypothetical protein n=1 Tax=Robertkochia flava TaxID=3447986 RepID=UPI001CCA25E2|nr:hypothetical protein [Robertkochia marina]
MNVKSPVNKVRAQLLLIENYLDLDMESGMRTDLIFFKGRLGKFLDYEELEHYLTTNTISNLNFISDLRIKCERIIDKWNNNVFDLSIAVRELPLTEDKVIVINRVGGTRVLNQKEQCRCFELYNHRPYYKDFDSEEDQSKFFQNQPIEYLTMEQVLQKVQNIYDCIITAFPKMKNSSRVNSPVIKEATHFSDLFCSKQKFEEVIGRLIENNGLVKQTTGAYKVTIPGEGLSDIQQTCIFIIHLIDRGILNSASRLKISQLASTFFDVEINVHSFGNYYRDYKGNTIGGDVKDEKFGRYISNLLSFNIR